MGIYAPHHVLRGVCTAPTYPEIVWDDLTTLEHPLPITREEPKHAKAEAGGERECVEKQMLLDFIRKNSRTCKLRSSLGFRVKWVADCAVVIHCRNWPTPMLILT
jgi:hypothetical protein